MKCEYYDRCETTFSDHRPVLAIFDAKVRKINKESHKASENEMLKKIIDGSAPIKSVENTETVQPQPQPSTQSQVNAVAN